MFTPDQLQEIAKRTMESFPIRNRELLASFSLNEVMIAIASWTRLHAHDKLQQFATSENTGDLEDGIDFFNKHLDSTLLRMYDEERLKTIYPLTALGQKSLADLRRRVGPVMLRPGSVIDPGPLVEAAKPAEPVPSKWDSLTEADLNKMSVREQKSLYASNLAFKAAYDRLAATEAAANALPPTTTGFVYIQRQDNKHFLWKWEAGSPHWIPTVDYRLGRWDYPTANRYIQTLAKLGIVALAFELDGRQVDVAPGERLTGNESAQKPETTWRVVHLDLSTTGRPNHRSGFLLRYGSENGPFVAHIDEANRIVKTVNQTCNARVWTSRETLVAAAENIEGHNFWPARHDGERVSW
jgi:hypothetical protein